MTDQSALFLAASLPGCLVASLLCLVAWLLLCWWFASFADAREAGAVCTDQTRGSGPTRSVPKLSSWLARHQLCPTCHRPCNVEHVAFEEFAAPNNQAIALLYCEACDVGFEILYVYDGAKWCREFSVRYSAAAKPEDFARFKARLEDATTVEA
ncbi:MAG TPA: hypothetical protein VM243_08440 [Phycisphaerae bacterium]|nr:hypothetical protein [Phycisphaerae bacterium]